MYTTTTIHDVTAIRVHSPESLTSGEYRDVEIETANGDVFRVIAFSDSASGTATVEVEDQSAVPERHLEAG